MNIAFQSFGRVGNVLVGITCVGIVLLWGIGFYAQLMLPDRVPIHFSWVGEATNYSEKGSVLFVCLLLSLGPLLLLACTVFRFPLMNRVPHLVNLQGLSTCIGNIEEQRQGGWVNRYFELLAGFNAGLTLLLDGVGIMIVDGARHGVLSLWFMPSVMVFPALLIIPFLLRMRRLSKEIAAEAASHISREK